MFRPFNQHDPTALSELTFRFDLTDSNMRLSILCLLQVLAFACGPTGQGLYARIQLANWPLIALCLPAMAPKPHFVTPKLKGVCRHDQQTLKVQLLK